MKQQSEWFDTLNEIIWEFAKLPCAWCFQRIRRMANEFVVHGKCRETDCADLIAFTESNQAVLKIFIKSFKENVAHHKKVQI